MNNPLQALNADWMEVHSVTSFIKEVDPNFKWKGIGWYPKVNGHDTLYVSPPRLGKKGENLYEFYVYNGRDPRVIARRDFAILIGDKEYIHPHTDGLDGLWEGAHET